jgi:hypothetical protein
LSTEEEAYQIVTVPAGAPVELQLSRSGFEQLLQEQGLATVMEELLEAVHHSAAGTTLAAAEMTRQLSIKGDLLQLHHR